MSRAAKQLDEEIGKWRTRTLENHRYLVLDAWYEKDAPTTYRMPATMATAVCVAGILAPGLLPSLVLGPLGS